MRTKQELLLSIPFEYLLGFIEETILTRGKNNYFTKKDFVHCLINSLDFSECEWLVKNYENDIPYKKAASEYLEFHPTGNMLTKKFSDVIKKSYNEEIILYEFLIPSTRADIVQIGDLSQAYELKSIRDSFKRILNQILALEKIFDITYIVVSFDALKECEKYVDDIVGIYFYNVRKDGVSFQLLKSAKRSNFINLTGQLIAVLFISNQHAIIHCNNYPNRNKSFALLLLES